MMKNDFLENPFNKKEKKYFSQYNLALYSCIFFGIVAVIYNFFPLFHTQNSYYIPSFIKFNFFNLRSTSFFTNYFDAITPIGYGALYKFISLIKINDLNYQLAISTLLNLSLSYFSFKTFLKIKPCLYSTFTCSILVNLFYIFSYDGLIATPKSFYLPLIISYIYFLINTQYLKASISIIIQSLLYPISAALSIATLCLVMIKDKKSLQIQKTQTKQIIISIIFTTIILLIYIYKTSELGNVINITSVLKGNHTNISGNNLLDFLFINPNTSIFGVFLTKLKIKNTLLSLLITLVILFFSVYPFYKNKSKPAFFIILTSVIAGSLLYAISCIFMFEIYLPNRYIEIILSYAFSIGIIYSIKPKNLKIITSIAILFFIFSYNISNDKQIIKTYIKLKEIPELLTKENIVATKTNDISILKDTKANIFFSNNLKIVFHKSRYDFFKKLKKQNRTIFNTSDKSKLDIIISHNNIDYILIEKKELKLAQAIKQKLQNCLIKKENNHYLIDAKCLKGKYSHGNGEIIKPIITKPLKKQRKRGKRRFSNS